MKREGARYMGLSELGVWAVMKMWHCIELMRNADDIVLLMKRHV